MYSLSYMYALHSASMSSEPLTEKKSTPVRRSAEVLCVLLSQMSRVLWARDFCVITARGARGGCDDHTVITCTMHLEVYQQDLWSAVKGMRSVAVVSSSKCNHLMQWHRHPMGRLSRH